MSFLRATTIATAAVALLLLAVVARGEVLSAQSDPLRVRARPALAGETLRIVVASGRSGERSAGIAHVWLADGEHTTHLRSMGCRGLLLGSIDIPADQPVGTVRLQIELRTRGDVRTVTLAAHIVADKDADRAQHADRQKPARDDGGNFLQRRQGPHGQRWEQSSRDHRLGLRQRQNNRQPERLYQASKSCGPVRP